MKVLQKHVRETQDKKKKRETKTRLSRDTILLKRTKTKKKNQAKKGETVEGWDLLTINSPEPKMISTFDHFHGNEKLVLCPLLSYWDEQKYPLLTIFLYTRNKRPHC